MWRLTLKEYQVTESTNDQTSTYRRLYKVTMTSTPIVCRGFRKKTSYWYPKQITGQDVSLGSSYSISIFAFLPKLDAVI